MNIISQLWRFFDFFLLFFDIFIDDIFSFYYAYFSYSRILRKILSFKLNSNNDLLYRIDFTDFILLILSQSHAMVQ